MGEPDGPTKPTTLAINPDRADHCRVVAAVLDRIGDQWTFMVVSVLTDGPARFTTIMREMDGVTHRMLTLTLSGLERDGLVKRTAYATVPPGWNTSLQKWAGP